MNWFKVEVRRGASEPYQFVGAAEATLESLAQQLKAGQAVRLDHLLYWDREKVKDWAEWDKALVPSVVINPSEVVTIMQFKGDPRVLYRE
jgi:hypothetical protein